VNHVAYEARAPRAATAARRLATLARTYLRALRLDHCELSLTLVTDPQIRRINRRWRQIDRPTDVLSFPSAAVPTAPGAPRSLGDVVISIDTARARASDEQRPVQAELARYLAHGLLHVLGHDHHQPAEARRMARAERELLGSAGLVEAALGKPARARAR